MRELEPDTEANCTYFVFFSCGAGDPTQGLGPKYAKQAVYHS
jgi:hypothetical protein